MMEASHPRASRDRPLNVLRRAGLGVLFLALAAPACGGGDSGGNSSGGPANVGGADAGGTSGSGGGGTGSGGATGGSDGGIAECASDTDCVAKMPTTNPAGCAEAKCDLVLKTCNFLAKDSDGDGHTAAKCAAESGGSILTGDDCNDDDPNAYPGSWDGPLDPSDPAKPERCDTIDQDCDGNADDEKVGGKGCACDPLSPPSCNEAETGGAITGLDVTTAGQGVCTFGKRECVNGNPGKCIGAVGPTTEICNAADDNCNGSTDDNVPAAPSWFKDSDNDDYGDVNTAPVKACVSPGVGWKQGIPNTDCNDADLFVKPGTTELCNDDNKSGTMDGADVDEDCNGDPWDGCACANGATKPCGTCNDGTFTCADGAWSVMCSDPTPDVPQWMTDKDSDGNGATGSLQASCSQPAGKVPYQGSVGDLCDNTAGVSTPSTEICNGIDDDCDGTADNVTGTCNVKGLAQGACLAGGTPKCSGTTLGCTPKNSSIGQNSFQITQAPNGSWDWNCDGSVEYQYPTSAACSSRPQATCMGTYVASQAACGTTHTHWDCLWSGSACTQGGTAYQSPQGCR